MVRVCPYCSQEFDNKALLILHLNNFHVDRSYRVRYVGPSLSQQQQEKLSGKKVFFKCMYCPKKFLTQRGLAYHTPSKHIYPRTPIFRRCPICKATVKDLFLHLAQHPAHCCFCLEKGEHH